MRYFGFSSLVVLWVIVMGWRRVRGRRRAPSTWDQTPVVYDPKQRAAIEAVVDERARPCSRTPSSATSRHSDERCTLGTGRMPSACRGTSRSFRHTDDPRAGESARSRRRLELSQSQHTERQRPALAETALLAEVWRMRSAMHQMRWPCPRMDERHAIVRQSG